MAEEYLGEFYYAFYTPRGLYDETIRFYKDICGFPVVGPRDANGAAYIECGGGRFEIRKGDVNSGGKMFMLRGAADYQAPYGGCLLIEVKDVDALHRRLALTSSCRRATTLGATASSSPTIPQETSWHSSPGSRDGSSTTLRLPTRHVYTGGEID